MPSIDRDRLDQILQRVRGARIVVVGDAMLDVYLTGQVSRISPEAPVPVVQVAEERAAPGGAANVAAAIRALGGECELVAVVGEDAAGETLRRLLAETGVGSEHLLSAPGRPTTTKTRLMARHHHVVRFDRESEDDVREPLAGALAARIVQALESADALILEDYNKGVLVPSVIAAALREARRRGLPSLADPKFRHFLEYGGVHLLKPNALELAAAFGLPAAPRDREGLAAARERLGCRFLLLTLGDEGMILLGPEGESHTIPAVPRDVFDVSGAGDTVTATAAACLAAGTTELEAALVANYAASVEVGKAGVVPVTPEEILDAHETERIRREAPAWHQPGPR